ADPGLNFWMATGTDPAHPSASGAGTMPGKITWNPFATHGTVQTETASIGASGDQPCTDTGLPLVDGKPVPIEANTSCGMNMWFEVTPNGRGSQIMSMVLNQ